MYKKLCDKEVAEYNKLKEYTEIGTAEEFQEAGQQKELHRCNRGGEHETYHK